MFGRTLTHSARRIGLVSHSKSPSGYGTRTAKHSIGFSGGSSPLISHQLKTRRTQSKYHTSSRPMHSLMGIPTPGARVSHTSITPAHKATHHQFNINGRKAAYIGGGVAAAGIGYAGYRVYKRHQAQAHFQQSVQHHRVGR